MGVRIVDPIEFEKRKVSKVFKKKSHSTRWVSFSLPADLYDRLEKYRRENCVNVSEYIRRLLDADLTKKGY